MTRAMLRCAGLGTRLGALSDERPKPMLPGSPRILCVLNTSRTMPLALCMKHLVPSMVTMATFCFP